MRSTPTNSWCKRRHLVIVICTLVVCFVFLPRNGSELTPTPPPTASHKKTCQTEYVTITKSLPQDPLSLAIKLNPKSYVLNPSVTGKFRDNLRPELNYVTAFCLGGFTNQFMCFINLIYLGMISDRIAVVPPFTPSHHISREAGTVAFGELFDLDRLRVKLAQPIIEWSHLKRFPARYDEHSTVETEPLGCWNPRDGKPSGQSFSEHLRLDVSYTQAPGEVFINEGHWHDHTNFWNLAALIYPKHPLFENETFPVVHPSPKGNHDTPDRHLACFDTTYYVGSGAYPFEWEQAWSPAWRYVATHLKFSKKINELADRYIKTAFKVLPSANVPPFIAVHVRHGDFSRTCKDSKDDCPASLPSFAKRVEEVKQELIDKHGITVTRVLISSDDTTEIFWEQVEALGWHDIDHGAERTTELYGEWYLPVIDVATHSRAVGFVGTSGSTLSLVSARRVEDWNNGPTRLVKWGRKGADDY